MPWIDYRELRDRLDVLDVLAWLNWRIAHERGDYLRGICPFCGSAESSRGKEFVVHRVRKLYHCFRCKQGGNILDLWSRYHKIDLNTAAKELNDLSNRQTNRKSSNSQTHSFRPPI
jgi:DNA primase